MRKSLLELLPDLFDDETFAIGWTWTFFWWVSRLLGLDTTSLFILLLPSKTREWHDACVLAAPRDPTVLRIWMFDLKVLHGVVDHGDADDFFYSGRCGAACDSRSHLGDSWLASTGSSEYAIANVNVVHPDGNCGAYASGDSLTYQ